MNSLRQMLISLGFFSNGIALEQAGRAGCFQIKRCKKVKMEVEKSAANLELIILLMVQKSQTTTWDVYKTL